MGRKSCPISTLSALHHCHIEQVAQTDIWGIGSMCNPTMKDVRILTAGVGLDKVAREREIQRVRENIKSDTSKIVRQIMAKSKCNFNIFQNILLLLYLK
jgi:hypothetical protein